MAKQFLFFIALAVVFTLSRSDPDQTPKAPPSEELIKYGFPIRQTSEVTALTRPQAASSCFLTTSLSRRITTWRLTRRKSPGKSSKTASRLSSSGGASPESDPAATTWCSRLEWSPPNTLLRISTRALSVRASAPLLEAISMHFLPWFYETGEKEDGAMKLGSKELNIDIGDTPLVCANAVVQCPGSIGFEEWVGRVKTSLENVDEILFFDEAKQEVALFFGKGYEKLGHQEYNGPAGEVLLREAVEMFSNKLRDDSGPVVEMLELSQGKSENVEGPKMDKIVESGFRDYTVSYKSKLVEDQWSSSKSVSKEDGSKKKKAKAWDMNVGEKMKCWMKR
nr:uncharacterized protein LOC109186882 [Ipomoea trifida]